MPDYENFVQRCTLETVQQNPIGDVLYHFIGSMAVKWFMYHTKRRDFLLFSTYHTEMTTYITDAYRVRAIGLLNNFYATLEPEGKLCF